VTRWLLLTSALALAGCGEILGLDAYGSGNAGGAASVASSSDAASTASTGGGGVGGAGVGGSVVFGPYAKQVIEDGASVYWRLGESVVGEPAADAIGLLDGTYSRGAVPGEPGLLTGEGDTAVKLPGGSEKVTIDTDQLTFTATQKLTIEAWIKPQFLGGRIFAVFEGSELTGGTGYSLWINGDGSLNFTRGNGMLTTRSTFGLRSDVRSYVVVAYDGTNVCLYVDAAMRSCNDGGVMDLANVPPMIGGAGYTGVIDEVAIYKLRLPTAAIQEHFMLGR
jgi:hypothetical protein